MESLAYRRQLCRLVIEYSISKNVNRIMSLAIAANIPKDCSDSSIREYFSSVGIVSKVHCSKRNSTKDDTQNKIAYITYNKKEDCTLAVEKLNKTIFNGHRITVRISGKKKLEGEESKDIETTKVQEIYEDKEKEVLDTTKTEKINRKARLIVRNLSFKATENEVKKYFSQFGKVLDVNLLKKDDGRLKGCCFIQFEKTMEANKALMNANAKEFKGRLIAVDWALPKARYLEGKAENTEDTTEATNDTTEITSEDRLNNLNSNASDESDSAIESCNDSQENDADTALEEEDENDDNFDDNPDDDDDDSEGERRWEGEKHKQTHQPSDVQEGKTVFLSNLPLDIEEDALKQEMESFGKVIYALVCLDKLLERPKGTGFVKYQTTESAQACIEAGKNKSIVLDGRQINAVLAMSKEYILNKGQDAKKKGKDKRNLYLAREGTIRMGTSAAQNVSKSDMDKRSQLNRLKRQLLSNLHMVVSPVRLCINNLPLSLDDNGLEKLIKKYGPKAARITEARVMKDLKSVDSKGKRLSKGYGFVSFVRHEDALETLRRINNNPEVFSINKRPIVEFSVENMKALRARERRLERSKEVLEAKETGTPTGRKGKKRKIDLQHTPVSDKKEKDKDYVGALSDPKDKKLFTHIGPKNRHDKKKNRISRNSLKKNRRQKKQAIKSSDAQEPVAKKAKKEKEKKTPKKMIPDNSQFNSLVQSYKAKLSAVPNSSRQKWFET